MIMYSIQNDRSQVESFLQLITEAKSLTIKNNYLIYLEHSLSGFGEPDTVIIADKTVYFIEFKVRAGSKDWSLKKQLDNFEKFEKDNQNYKYCASNIFYQLYLKKLLFKNRNNLPSSGLPDERSINKHGKNIMRQIGNNVLVKSFLQEIQNCDFAKYIAIVPINEHLSIDEHLSAKFENHNFIPWKSIRMLYKDNPLIESNFKYNQLNNQIY